MKEDTVPPHEEEVEAVEAVEPEINEAAEEEVQQDLTTVPLHALQKERRKRQEIEAENRWLKEQQQRKADTVPEPDESKYESATKEDLGKTEEQILRKVEERHWIKNNPEKFEKINDLLPEFLKRRPNLAAAIEGAPNRYEEAWELMDKLSPKEQQKLKTIPKRDAPGAPGSVPKGAVLNQSVDVMAMNDAEFSAWRQSKKRRVGL